MTKRLQNLDEYLRTLVKAISITPSTEALLRNPQAVLDAALASTTGSSAVEEDDPGNAVEKVTFRVPYCSLLGHFLRFSCLKQSFISITAGTFNMPTSYQ